MECVNKERKTGNRTSNKCFYRNDNGHVDRCRITDYRV